MMLRSIRHKSRDYLSKLQKLSGARGEPKRPASLLRLPAELQMAIASHLHPFSAVSLKLTCRHLYSVLPMPASILSRPSRLWVLAQFPPRGPHSGMPPMLCGDCVRYHPPDWEVRVSRLRGLAGFTRRGRHYYLRLTSANDSAQAPALRCVGHPPERGRRPLRKCKPCRRCMRYGAVQDIREPGRREWFMLCHCGRTRYILMARPGPGVWRDPVDDAFWWTRDKGFSIW